METIRVQVGRRPRLPNSAGITEDRPRPLTGDRSGQRAGARPDAVHIVEASQIEPIATSAPWVEQGLRAGGCCLT